MTEPEEREMIELWIDDTGETRSRYPIVLGSGALAGAGARFDAGRYSSVAVVTDERVAEHWLGPLQESWGRPVTPVVIPAGESFKTWDTVREVWTAFQEAGLDRHSLVIDLGGGVVGDLGGFAASTYMRGVDFLQVPTTLLAQVDASIGGKVGVNEAGVKNLVGAFCQPVGVVIDPDTLRTLPEREYRAGFAEIVKHGVIRDREYLGSLDARLLDPGHGDLRDVIRTSCEIKGAIVSEDAREHGVRKLLNFGHTIGHAVESWSLMGPSPLLHGEAVALGMVAEARLSERVGLLERGRARDLARAVSAFGLPTRLPEGIDVDAIVSRIHTDKKSRGGQVAWTLLRELGEGTIDRQVPEDEVRHVLRELTGDR